MAIETFSAPKDPADVKDYKFDFAPNTNGVSGYSTDLLESGETIISHTITTDAGLTVDSSITDTNTSVTVWVSGGENNTSYNIVCKIVTSSSRTYEKTGTIYVMNQ